MSNELTPQEKYRKFYEDPHLWIDAIEVKRTNSKVWHPLSLLLLHEITCNDDIAWYEPKFKPQEGEAFIKDLEEAVSAGFRDAKARYYKTPSSIVFEVIGAEIEVWQDLRVTTSSGAAFDTAAYVDTLRKLGNYL
jgi:hypothetical protein